jgi:ribosomal protein S18 acetylase RimI-like enzyme
VIVRPATAADADAMARVHCESYEAAYDRARDPVRTRERWRAMVAEPGVATFAAVDDGEIVGVLSVGPARDESGDGEVYVIYVHPDRWGSSAGQRLIDQAHDELAAGHVEAVLTVLAANARARRFYERNEWALEGLSTEPHFGGEPTEVARYRRKLSGG